MYGLQQEDIQVTMHQTAGLECIFSADPVHSPTIYLYNAFDPCRVLSEILWGASLYAFEYPVEVGLIVKTASNGNIEDVIHGFNEHSCGVANPQLVEEGNEGFAGLALNESAEGDGGHVHAPGNIF